MPWGRAFGIDNWQASFKTEACVVRPAFGQKPGLVRPSQVRGGGHLDMLDAQA